MKKQVINNKKTKEETPEKNVLQDIVSYVNENHASAVIVFSGDDSQSKTIAAKTLANQLGLEIFRVDISKVASKYIEETEKNLRKVFDVAEKGGFLLYFDEADDLFGKHSETEDTQEHQNGDCLLDLLRNHSGLSILAMKSSNSTILKRAKFVARFTLRT